MVQRLLRLILSTFTLFFASNLWARDGQFLCSPTTTLYNNADDILSRTINYQDLEVTRLLWGEHSYNQPYYVLDFTQPQAKIQIHHNYAHYKSGVQVYRERPLQRMNSAIGTHSGVELYKAKDSDGGLWPLIHQSQKSLPNSFMPSDANTLARQKAYVLVGRRLGIIGVPRGFEKPLYSFCIKQTNKDMSGQHMREAYKTLLLEYRQKIKPKLQSNVAMVFEEQNSVVLMDKTWQRERAYDILEAHFSNLNNVFISENGRLLAFGAFTTTSLVATRLLMKRNLVASFIPPSILNDFMANGKTVIYLPVNTEISLKEVESLFKESSKENILQAMEEVPELAAYLHTLAFEIINQTTDPKGI